MGFLNNPRALKKQAERAERKARKAEIKATKTFHRTGAQLKKADRAERTAARLDDAAKRATAKQAGKQVVPRGMVRCVKNGHLLDKGKYDVCPIDGSELSSETAIERES